MLLPGHVEALHAPEFLGMLFADADADADALTDEPGVADAARRAVQAMAAMLTDCCAAAADTGCERPR